MRISDCSSDVCSADLVPGRCDRGGAELRIRHRNPRGADLRQGEAARQRRSVGTRDCREPCRRCALSLSATDFQGPSDSVIQAIAFYLFAIVVIAAAAMTISARNPVHSVLWRSEEHTSELQSLMRISYAVFCLKKKTQKRQRQARTQ